MVMSCLVSSAVDKMQSSEKLLAASMRKMWYNFVKTGNLGYGWPKWNPSKQQYVVLDTTAFIKGAKTAVFKSAKADPQDCTYMEP